MKRIKVAPDSKTYSDPNGQFSLIKSDSIKVIGNLSYCCTKNQDLVADSDGLGVILDHCSIQDDYPFMKESSIFALRNLTEGHLRNQEMIAKLEPIRLTESSQSLLKDIARNQSCESHSLSRV